MISVCVIGDFTIHSYSHTLRFSYHRCLTLSLRHHHRKRDMDHDYRFLTSSTTAIDCAEKRRFLPNLPFFPSASIHDQSARFCRLVEGMLSIARCNVKGRGPRVERADYGPFLVWQERDQS